MIDYKIGETKVNTNNKAIKQNYNEENILAQIRLLREIISKAEEKREKQTRFTNIILIIILIALICILFPSILTLVLLFG